MNEARLAVIYTGGTISMRRSTEDGAARPALSGNDIADSVPELRTHFAITSIEFGAFPGPHMKSSRVLELKRVVDDALKDHDGVVIAHGTDTLEETAFQLDILHQSSKPVVLVGAMRTSDQLSWDGPVNLMAGCLVASSPKVQGFGVIVVMSNTIHAASEVTKTYTEALDTFVSPDSGPLGVIDLNQVRVFRSPLERRLIKGWQGQPAARVALIASHQDADGTLIRAALAAGSKGLVISAMGRGNIPPLMAEAAKEATASGLPWSSLLAVGAEERHPYTAMRAGAQTWPGKAACSARH